MKYVKLGTTGLEVSPVAIGGKQEVGRDDPGDVLSAESFAAYEALAEAAHVLWAGEWARRAKDGYARACGWP